MQYQFGALAICVVVFAYGFLRRYRRLATIKDIPGPVNPSWIFGMCPGGQPDPFRLFSKIDGIEFVVIQGHQWYIQAEEAGAVDKRFLEHFGNIVHWNGPFGVRLASPAPIYAGVLYSNPSLKQLVCACRRTVCGSRTRRPSTTSFRNPVISMRNRPTFGNR